MPTEKEVLSLFSDMLDRLIKTESQNTQALTHLCNNIENNSDILKEISDGVDEINKHFSNGFKQELKSHINKELESSVFGLDRKFQECLEILSSNAKYLKMIGIYIKDPWRILKFFLILLASLVALTTAIVTLVIKFVGGG